MKYWLLTTEFPPFFGGGISTYCLQTVRMLVSAGYDVSVFLNDASVTDVKTVQFEGARVIRFSTSRTRSAGHLGHLANVSYEFADVIRQYVEQEGPPDVIEAQEYLGIAYYLLLFKRLSYPWCAGIPVVITAHSPSFLYLEYNDVPVYQYPYYWIGEMERFSLQAADLVLYPSSYLQTELAKRMTLTAESKVVVNPFQLHDESGVDVVPGHQIIFYGKLSAQKGTFRLLEYFRQLWQQGSTEKLYLVGGSDIIYHPDGRTMKAVVQSKYAAEIKSGLLVPDEPVEPHKLSARLREVKLVIVPSIVDNLPYVVLEMMAARKLVLISRQGGQSEIIEDGVSGFVFDHDAPGSFAAALARALALNTEEYKRITEHAYHVLKTRFSFEIVYARKSTLIGHLLQMTGTGKDFPLIRPTPSKPLLATETIEGLLTVVVPYFNMGKYIDETIASVLASDYRPLEVLIINDGSTEKLSRQALERHRGNPLIRISDIANGGLANARNTGARNAGGEFLAFLDADDTVEPAYYTKAIRALRNSTNLHFVGSWTRYFEDSIKVWPTFNPEPPMLLYHNLVNSSALVYKRAAFLTYGLNDTDMNFSGLEDYESVIHMVSEGCHGAMLPETLFNYRVRHDSMIRGISIVKKLILTNHIAAKYSSFYSKFAVDIYALMNANGPGLHLDNPTLDYHLMDKMPFKGKFARQVVKLIKRNKHARSFAFKLYRFLNK